MQYSNQEKRLSQNSNTFKTKLIENKGHLYNQHREYEDEQNILIPKGSDSSEVRDLKGKIKLVMTKLTSVKKERDQFQKQNKILQ